MGEIWLPQWRRVALGGPDGDPYNDEENIKLLWHDWEGTSWGNAESAFRPYPPHAGAKIFDEVRQYVPLDEHAYALLGSRNENEFVIQIELAGFAHDMAHLTNEEKDWIAHHVLEPILFFFPNIPDVHPPFYDDTDGFTIASAQSPIRFSFPDWVSYSGHVGHQHAPAPDEHWDPGKLDLDYIIRVARQAGNIVKPTEEPLSSFTYVARKSAKDPKPIHALFDSGKIEHISNFLNFEEVYVNTLGVKFVPYKSTVSLTDGAKTARPIWVIGDDALCDDIGLPR